MLLKSGKYLNWWQWSFSNASSCMQVRKAEVAIPYTVFFVYHNSTCMLLFVT